jgi:RNA polymerase sigma-70 factor (ECF subfamily)
MEDIPKDLIEQAQAGDMEAFESIYRAASGFVFSVALRITNSTQEAQEVTQDVFVKIYRNLKGFQFRSSFKTWAYRITANTAFNAYKRISREMNRREDFDSVANTEAVSDDAKKETATQEERREKEARLESLLTMLNPEQRMCIVLREIEGLSYQEMSEALNLNINTVRSRLKRARETLLAHSKGGRNEL